MTYQSELVNNARNSQKEHRLLEFARKVCKDNFFAYNEKIARLYRYSDGLYVPIKTGNSNSRIDNIIINSDGGNRLSVSERANIIKNIETLSYVDDSRFDVDYLNFTNTLFCVNTLRPVPHSPDIFSINRIPYAFDHMADCNVWKKFLNDVMEGDQVKIEMLQDFSGYCLIKSCKFEKALVLPGGGQNGKGTFTNTILHMIGRDNVSAASMSHLSDEVSRASILNKYLNIDTEVPKRAEKFESSFKQIVSGEEMLFNEKYIAPYSKAPYCKLIFSANEIPRIDESTMGFYRRLLIVPFNRQISDSEKDVNLKEKLLNELPGIFLWALAGLQRLRRRGGFNINKETTEAVEELRMDNSPMLQFAQDHVYFKNNPDEGTNKNDLYAEYRKWCDISGHKPMTYRRFNSTFYAEFKKKTSKDVHRKNDSRDRFWPGVFIKSNLEMSINKEVYREDI